jgi:hypothetical protein
MGQAAVHWRAGLINPYKIVYSLTGAQPHENPMAGYAHAVEKGGWAWDLRHGFGCWQ